MKANFFNAKRAVLTLFAMLTICVANVWAAVGDVTTLIDFTQTGNLGHSSYTDTWTIAANTNSSGNVQCAVGYALSNNEKRLRAGGGKSSNLSNKDCYIGTKSATSVPVSVFSVNVETVTSDANITINSVKLYVYSNSSWSTQVDCVERTSSYATGAVTFTPTSGTVWTSGVYFKLVWNITTSATGSNHYTAIDKLQITEGSTKTLVFLDYIFLLREALLLQVSSLFLVSLAFLMVFTHPSPPLYILCIYHVILDSPISAISSKNLPKQPLFTPFDLVLF